MKTSIRYLQSLDVGPGMFGDDQTDGVRRLNDDERQLLNVSVVTVSGKVVRVFNPDPGTLDIDDIAHGLSNLPMYGGQTIEFYSVAQHCVLVSAHCKPAAALTGLLHHAVSTYLPQVSLYARHIDYVFPWSEAPRIVNRAIQEKFGVDFPWPKSVNKTNKMVSATEARDLFHEVPASWREPLRSGCSVLPRMIEPWTPGRAARLFMLRFKALTRRK